MEEMVIDGNRHRGTSVEILQDHQVPEAGVAAPAWADDVQVCSHLGEGGNARRSCGRGSTLVGATELEGAAVGTRMGTVWIRGGRLRVTAGWVDVLSETTRRQVAARRGW